jgi:hypothetical protein
MRTIFRILLYFSAFIAILDIFVAVITGTKPRFLILFENLFYLIIGLLGLVMLLIKDLAHLRFNLVIWDLQNMINLLFAFVLTSISDIYSLVMAILQMPFSFLAGLLQSAGIDPNPLIDFGGAGNLRFRLSELSFLADLNLEIIGVWLDFKVCIFPARYSFHGESMDALSVGFWFYTAPLGEKIESTTVISLGKFLQDLIAGVASAYEGNTLKDIVEYIYKRF